MAGLMPITASTNLLPVAPSLNAGATSGVSFAAHLNQASGTGQPGGQVPSPAMPATPKTNGSAGVSASGKGQVQPAAAPPAPPPSPLPTSQPAGQAGSAISPNTVAPDTVYLGQASNPPSLSAGTVSGLTNAAAPVIPLLNLPLSGFSVLGVSPVQVNQSINAATDAPGALQNGSIASQPETSYTFRQANLVAGQSGLIAAGIGLETATQTAPIGRANNTPLNGAPSGGTGNGQPLEAVSNNASVTGNNLPSGRGNGASSPAGNAGMAQPATQVAQVINGLQAEKSQLMPLADLSALTQGKNVDNTAAGANPLLQPVHSAFDFSANAIRQAARAEFSGQNMNGGNSQNSGTTGDNHSPSTPGLLAGNPGETNPILDSRFTLDTSSRHDVAGSASNQLPGINTVLSVMQASGGQPSDPSNLPSTAGSANPGSLNPTMAALEKSMATEVPAAPSATGMVNNAVLAENGGRIEMRVDLRTDSLGAIQLHAVLQDGRLGASIGVENREAHTLMNSELPALHQNLIEKNVQVEHLSVVDSGASSRDSGQMMAGSNSGSANQHPQETLIWRTGESGTLPETGQALSSEAPAIVDVGRLSVLA